MNTKKPRIKASTVKKAVLTSSTSIKTAERVIVNVPKKRWHN